jgi:hexosaminidase
MEFVVAMRSLWLCNQGIAVVQCTDSSQPPATRAARTAQWLLAAVMVIPAPREVTQSAGVFTLDSQAMVTFEGGSAAQSVARQFIDRLRTVPGVRLAPAKPVAGRPAGPSEPSRTVRFAIDPAASVAREGYRLDITPSAASVTAQDVAGLRNGAVTLWQLAATQDIVRTDAPAASPRVAIPAVRVDDAPAFAWRGLMLDSARHYQSPEFIERLIEWMALHKLNVLHWHLTDDQAWRLEIRRYPRLTEVGAWRVPAGRAAQRDVDPATGRPRLYGGFYTQETVRRIVKYAAERNVTIVPELDMPGHASAAIAAYPDLGVDGAQGLDQVPADWGIYPNLYNVEETTFAFLENVLREVLELFPGRYVHIGGDEAVKDQWRASPRVQVRMRDLGVKDEAALQGYFVQRIGRFLSANGRRLVGWDEILEGGLAADTTVMSWRGVDGARAAAIAGHDAVLAAWPTLYFDNRQGATLTEPPGRGRVVTLRDVYDFDTSLASAPSPADAEHAGGAPLKRGDALSTEQLRHVIGVQGNVWTEHIRTEQRVEWMAWPRAAAIAELGWTPRDHRHYEDFRERLEAAQPWYRAMGLHAATSEFEATPARSPTVRRSQELELCSDKLVLNLEDDAPISGPRAVFLVDILNPCWMWRGVDLSRGATLIADVGQFPFNFQVGRDRDTIHLREPRTPAGELEVRAADCDGEVVASLPLDPALDRDDITRLPVVRIGARRGTQDLCFRFTSRGLDPMWAVDRIELQLLATPERHGVAHAR